MLDEKRYLIQEMAEEVRKVYQISVPIQNIFEDVRKIGGNVVLDPFLDMGESELRKTGKECFEITVPSLDSIELMNFSIAQELGHLFLHMRFQTDRQIWDRIDDYFHFRTRNPDSIFQAKEFAYAFLMPQPLFKKVMEQYTEGTLVNTREIARYFSVPIDAAVNRGVELGYLRFWLE